jgi:hypothetical protein
MNTRSRNVKSFGLMAGSLALVVVAGCAQMPMNNSGSEHGSNQAAAAGNEPASTCNPALAGTVGALAGALFGKGKGHLVGAAVGAGIGAIACMAYNYHARQVRDAKSVEADYTRQHGALPATNTVSSYTSSLQPASTVQAGKQVEMQSKIVVLNGTQDTQPQLAETLTLFSPDGKQLSSVTKQAADISGTGGYQTNFSFNLPKGIKDGRYMVRSSLSMNGKQVGSNEMPMLVVG